ncbi:MAG: ECF-type sigma factor [Planctomycetota bacterium]
MEKSSNLECRGRTHFFNIAAKAMRQILTDHARRRKAVKRGGERPRMTLVDDVLAVGSSGDREIDLLDLSEALEELSALNERHAQVVGLRLFSGLTMQEIADELELSKPTIENDWMLARTWLHRRLKDRDGSDA